MDKWIKKIILGLCNHQEKYRKRYSISRVIKHTQQAMRYLFMLPKVANCQKYRKLNNLGRMGRIRILCTLLVGISIQLLSKHLLAVVLSQKVKDKIIYNVTIPLLSILPSEPKAGPWRYFHTPIHSSIIYSSYMLDAASVSVQRMNRKAKYALCVTE